MKAYERLLSYVKVFTPSSEETGTSPSTQYQFDLARLLVQELKELGVKDADVDEHCYVYGHIPATRGYESRQKLGFIAHMDTVSDFCDHPVTPVITPNYDGKDLALGTSGRVLSPKMFPHLSTLKGRTLITSDGTTILGADDKAGIAEIMTIIEHLNDNTIPHGPLCIAFTPDEEIGMGPAHFDIKKFGADFAYTLDGDTEGEIQYENFNAARAVVEFTGVNVHPGSSKNTMVNAALVAMEFNSMLPSADTPRDTEDYEGFFHLYSIKGDVSHAALEYIIRDHNATDGDTEGEIQYENFNAARAVVEFTGVNVHPGSSKNTMVNAALVAMEFNSMLPSADTPRDTEDYEGFFHLYSIKGDVSHAALEYIIRDHNATTFDVRKKTMEHITKILNEKWGKGTVSLTITEQYRNMKEIIDTCMELIEHATAACKECNIPPLITPIRGGTDGAQLSFMGLPCPNLGTGGHAYHGPYEHITVEGMDIAVDVGLKIIELFYK